MVEIIKKTDRTKKIELVLANKHDSQSWRQSSNYDEEWQTWHNLYRGIPDKKSYPWMSNKFIPKTMSIVETAVSNIMGVLFSNNPAFDVKPMEPSDVMQADIVKNLLKYQFEESNVYLEFLKLVRSIAVYGTGIGKVFWETKIQDVTEWADVEETQYNFLGQPAGVRVTGQMPVEREKQIYACPKLVTCNIEDIYPDPSSINIQDGWIIHRTRRSLDYLRQMRKNYPEYYTSDVDKLTNEDASERMQEGSEIDEGLGRLKGAPVKRTEGEGGIELLERWGMFPVDGRLVPYVMTVAAGKHLIVDRKNPYWHGKNPFVKAPYIEVNNEFYGVGVPEVLRDIQTNINEIVNQRNDNISMALNRPVIYNQDSLINNPNKMVLKPGGLYAVRDKVQDSLAFQGIDNYTRDSFNHIEYLEKLAQEVTAVTSAGQGIDAKGQTDTASGIAMLQKASGNRFLFIARGIENQAFKETIKFFYSLDYQYIEEEEMIRIVGEKGVEWKKVSPQDVRRNYDFIPAGIFTMADKSQKALRLIQFYNIIKGNPVLKETELLRKIYSTLEIGEDSKEIIRDDAEMQELQGLAHGMAMQMSQAAFGGDTGGGAPSPGGPSNLVDNELSGTPGMPPPTVPIPPGGAS